ncbi:hypothetical protein [Planktothrix sp.]|jgi:hypothetical protein|uniref:hypothetical protein n=2 Tax=Planktothrix sp. TaxID=3088171 RepID=UPI0038D36F1D
MNNESQTDDEILVDMDEIDNLELEYGISAAPSRKLKALKGKLNAEGAIKDKTSGVSQRKINTKQTN